CALLTGTFTMDYW
nr:immunoglobulin heavy chain junction region [Mus musculus]